MENPVRCTGTNNRNRLSNHLRIKFLRSCYLLEFKPADMSSSMLKDVFLMVHITCRVRSKATKQQMLAFGHRTPNTQSKFAHLAHLICGLRAFVTWFGSSWFGQFGWFEKVHMTALYLLKSENAWSLELQAWIRTTRIVMIRIMSQKHVNHK